MDVTPRYDYAAQEWTEGYDHAHCRGDIDELLFCGALLDACPGDPADCRCDSGECEVHA